VGDVYVHVIGVHTPHYTQHINTIQYDICLMRLDRTQEHRTVE